MNMPAEWTPEQKLFPHQVGFTCPPHDWDAAPTDFQKISPSTVGVHGWMLHVPDYKHKLDQRKQNFSMLDDFVQCMSNNGADVCGQVGSNWVHACGLGVQGVDDFCRSLEDKYGVAFHMAGYAMVGFDVVWAGNYVDQGWFDTQEDVNALRWIFEGDLALKSFEYVAKQAPDVDVYLANGMCNWRSGENGQPQRILHLTPMLEAALGKPVIAHDTALYWRLFKSLSIKPVGQHGKLLESLS